MNRALDELEQDFKEKLERYTAASHRRQELMGTVRPLSPGMPTPHMSQELTEATRDEQVLSGEYETARDAYYAARDR